MSKPKLYRTPTGADFRTVMIDGVPWFVAKDVCRELGLGTAVLTNHLNKLDPGEKTLHPIQTPFGSPSMWVINKQGLSRLMMRSDKPQARAFQDWIINEVLPAIERDGIYMTVSKAESVVENSKTPEGLMGEMAAILERARDVIASQGQQIEEMKPIVQAFDTAWKGESGTMTNFYQMVTGQYAYGHQVGVLNQKLAAAGVLHKQHKVWHPTPEYDEFFIMQPKGRDGVTHTWQVEVRSSRRHELAAKLRPILSS